MHGEPDPGQPRNRFSIAIGAQEMPQLVKGGKHVFGWSVVGGEGRIVIPPEAGREYGIREDHTCLLIPGSKTSGGFGLGTLESLEGTPLSW